MFPSVEGKAK